jgi:hypothetical protein
MIHDVVVTGMTRLVVLFVLWHGGVNGRDCLRQDHRSFFNGGCAEQVWLTKAVPAFGERRTVTATSRRRAAPAAHGMAMKVNALLNEVWLQQFFGQPPFRALDSEYFFAGAGQMPRALQEPQFGGYAGCPARIDSQVADNLPPVMPKAQFVSGASARGGFTVDRSLPANCIPLVVGQVEPGEFRKAGRQSPPGHESRRRLGLRALPLAVRAFRRARLHGRDFRATDAHR